MTASFNSRPAHKAAKNTAAAPVKLPLSVRISHPSGRETHVHQQQVVTYSEVSSQATSVAGVHCGAKFQRPAAQRTSGCESYVACESAVLPLCDDPVIRSPCRRSNERKSDQNEREGAVARKNPWERVVCRWVPPSLSGSEAWTLGDVWRLVV